MSKNQFEDLFQKLVLSNVKKGMHIEEAMKKAQWTMEKAKRNAKTKRVLTEKVK